MTFTQFDIQGLTQNEVITSREKYGANKTVYNKENKILSVLKSIAGEPMVILLLIAASIYFVIGDFADGIFLAFAIILVAGISIIQDSRSNNALKALKEFDQPVCKVIRNGLLTEIKREELVVGDAMIIDEGTLIPADGNIESSNDFSVNESILTGESLPVFKDKTQENPIVFQGTTVSSGLAIATVISIGNQTKLGKIGKSLDDIRQEKTPMELQINDFVKKMVILGALVFVLVWLINYIHTRQILDSLLKSLTLAMSILPEEIPVALATFMAMGAWRLMKMGIVVKKMKTVETLGSATVICTDKTGTITENKMTLAKVVAWGTGKISDPQYPLSPEEENLITAAMWASEPIPFDPMEVALHQAYTKITDEDKRKSFKMIHEYPLDGTPPMMTHVFEDSKGNRIISAKGAPEAILRVSDLTQEDKLKIENTLLTLMQDGYRILAVAQSDFSKNNFPQYQQDLRFTFKGLVAFYDPPKKNIKSVFQKFENAGIKIKIITGDNAVTTAAIAKQIGFRGIDSILTGEELLKMDEVTLDKTVMQTQIFARMFPDAKLRVVEALKHQGQIVAMIGDGVNDGPALKSAHIGIAMGKKGSETAKQAASLILEDDDLAKLIDAIAMGRKIYANLKKAIRYIISIHIPIILTVFFPLVLNWVYPNIFTVVHIIFFELIMGPTCSIIYENEPMEKDLMRQKPRLVSSTIFNWKELGTSIIQGLMISAGTLFAYQIAVKQDYDEALTRTMVFTTLIVANIILTLVNRSFIHSIITTIKYKNRLVSLIITITLAITGSLIYIPTLSTFFGFKPLTWSQMLECMAIGFVSVIWYEIIKYIKRQTLRRKL